MNISLIGMPASGKTTVAGALNILLKNYSIIDIDEQIVQNEKTSINEIFEKNGEKYFREIETKILSKILNKDNQIISTGGGIVKSDKNIEILKRNSIVIYLKADIETLIKRAKWSNERPLLNNCNIKEKMQNLLNERERNYEKAHYTINVLNKIPITIAAEIMEKINGYSRS